ncbi:Protein SIP3 [Madurella mycetomatis]|uniref:Protein SIP3 n=1 Tax=Madurella mycetomatis TaxID=100816 RepID=A0A175W5P7_9PEZI|nr:Protein SIP3 [Madurella mycetomatis]
MNEPTIPPPAAVAGVRSATATPTATASTSAPGPPTSRAPQPSRTWTAGPAIPVALNEAALDSPAFRAASVHFSEQLDAIERWLDSYARSTSKVAHDVLALEDTINNYLSKISPPPSMASPTDSVVLDANYTLPAMRRAGDGAREWWGGILAAVRRLEPASVEPIRTFIQNELRAFREVRRALDVAQKAFDGTLARYVGQSKTKEPSSLREDAFAVFETRKAYLKAALDYCQMAPQVRAGLDKLLVKVCADVYKEMSRARETGPVNTWGEELERIRGWVRETETSEAVFRRELHVARREISEGTLAAYKPSRELEDYSISTVPYLGSKGPMSMQRKDQVAVISEKQGWLFLRLLTGKPVRTTWIRRWYYCRDGIFGWLVQGPQGVLQGDEIGVLLCSARPAVQEERRFCFEIKTKTQTIMLQAETQAQLIEWLEVFEVAKKKAIEASMGRDQNAPVGAADPAFSITPPSIPEFSAKNLDNLDETGGIERQGTLPVPGQDGGLAPRASFDTPRRAITTHLGREDGETGREHATRIMQKLDLHRKAAFTSSSETSTGGTAGSGLLSNTATSPQVGQGPPLRLPNPLLDQQPGSLAPLALAKPPIVTNLSKTAVLASANAGAARTLPSSVLANYWGSSTYTSMYCPAPTMPPTPKPDTADPFLATAIPRVPTAEKMAAPASLHRKTVSVDAKVADVKAQEKAPSEKFPLNYPSELRAQYAQFRLIFPTAPADDKPVLVFNAAWSSSSSQGKEVQGMAGDGRIFVTPDRMYFYGHQLGLIVAYAISLDSITELTAAPGRDCDFIFLHLSQEAQDAAFSRITIKVFLEDFSLLQSRLNLLIDDLQAAEPMELSEIIAALSNLDKTQDDKRSPSVESWEEVSSNTPIDDGTPFGRPVSRRVQDLNGRYGPSRGLKKPLQKLQLPPRPVVYEPPDMGKSVAERHFEISAKSCFHVLFGDKSFIFPKLYFERRATEIEQGPWELQDHGQMRRQFRFKVDFVDMLGRTKPGDVTDTQTIDIFSDHITYVVTHIKTPWHLPHSQAFKLVFKVVITHVSKSKCKLAIYTKVDWSKAPAFAKNMVQRQALDDAANDAEELAEVATDQVRRLGSHSRTKRAIQVYGNIGQQSQAIVFSPDTAAEGRGKAAAAAIRPRTLTDMMLETGRSFMESAITSVMMWAFAAVKRLFKIITANRVILVLLAVSAAYNLLVISQASSTWWLERKSARYMSRLGVGPNLVMSKAIYLADLEEAAGGSAAVDSRPAHSQCYNTFQSLVNTTSIDAPHQDAGAGFSSAASRATARRLRRTRQRLGGYRHDLLVAMRVVNGIELEMMQSEWENWLADETYRCAQVRGMLSRGEGDGEEGAAWDEAGVQKVLAGGAGRGGDGGKRREALKKWHAEYCGSCEADRKALVERRGLSSSAFVM